MFSYENLPVYKKAYETNQMVYKLLKENNVIPTYIKNQLRRACFSIMLNIAEGSAKFSHRDRCNFYIIASGSVFECSSLVNFLSDEGEIAENYLEDLCLRFEEISKILFSMIKNLKSNFE